MVDYLRNLFADLFQTVNDKFELEDKLETIIAWLKKGQNQKVAIAVGLIVLSIFILSIYACSQRPDL